MNQLKRSEAVYPVIREITSFKKACPAVVTQQEGARLLGMSISSISILNRNGKISYKKRRKGLVHYYDIRADDIISYHITWMVRYSKSFNQMAEKILNEMLIDVPDVMSVYDTSQTLGVGKTAVNKWIEAGRLDSFHCKGRKKIAKKDLVLYLSSPYYRGSNKSHALKEKLLKELEKQIFDFLEERNG